MRLRSAILAGLVLSAVRPALGADIPSVPASNRLDFAISRNGSVIGAHSARFSRDGDTLTVHIRVEIKVKFAFITVYRRTESKKETWHRGILVAYEHDGVDAGEAEQVRAYATGKRMVVSAPTGRPPVPQGTLVSTYWNAETVKQTALLDSTTGELVPITVAGRATEKVDLGQGPEAVMAYRIAGDLARTLLYDRNGVWAGMRLTAGDGSEIVYRRK